MSRTRGPATERQRTILTAILSWCESRTDEPTTEGIAALLGLDPAVVDAELDALAADGWLTLSAGL